MFYDHYLLLKLTQCCQIHYSKMKSNLRQVDVFRIFIVIVDQIKYFSRI